MQACINRHVFMSKGKVHGMIEIENKDHKININKS